MEMFNWAQDKIEEVTKLTKDQREEEGCKRRLAQMAKKRDKEITRRIAEALKGQGK